MAQQSPEGCNAAFAWLTELLALDIHSLRQVSARRPGTDTLRGMLRSDLILMMCRSFKAEPCTSWHWMPFTTAL